MADPLLIAVPAIVIIGIILFFLLPRYGPHYTSPLTCPNCRKLFNYHWIPGATVTSLRYSNNRRLRCPYCSQQATYNIAATRVRKLKPVQAKSRSRKLEH